MALEPGHGETAVPVRTTIFGTVLALATLTAALSFSGSLHRLVTTPALAGWNWDAIVPTGPDALPPLEKRLVADNSISSVGRGSMIGMGFGSSFVQQNFGNNSVFGMALDKGAIGPLVISGRLPTGSGEIALGPATYRSLHAQIGKTVPVIFGDPSSSEPLFKTPVHLRVVGVIAVPEFFFNIQPGGSGAAISMDELRAAAPSAGADAALFLRFAPGVSVADGTTRIKALLGPQGFVLQRTQATDQTNLKRLASLPAVLAGLLALLAAATLIHTLVSSVRRRRRDLAIMKTLGFVRSQVWLTVAWQATTIILISLALGLPLGAIAARWGWRAFVYPLGFVPQPVVPLLPILLSIPAALILANLIASFPARAAARTEPAVALRAE